MLLTVWTWPGESSMRSICFAVNSLAIFVSLTASASLAADPPRPAAQEKEPPSERAIGEWVEQLGDADFSTREAAQRALVAAGPYAMAAVLEAAKSDDLEVKRRAEEAAAQIETNAAKVFERLGADVQYRKEDGSVFSISFRENKGNKLADADLVHLQALPTLERLSLEGTRIADEGLKHVGRRTSLTFLNLGGTQISDASLAHLTALDRLEQLELDRTNVKGPGLVHLKSLTSLKGLDLAKSQISDVGLKEGIVGLKDLEHLTDLSLYSTKITDDGLVHLSALKRMRFLRLDGTPLTGAGLVHLKDLPNLDCVNLAHTRLTDDTCDQLAELKGHVRILLSDTHVTTMGLRKLALLPKLKRLDIGGIKLTEAERHELRQLMPNVVLER
jgi:Leucine-rich repeat (LRR) protein